MKNEFLSPNGIRALSRYHAEYPYVFHAGGQESPVTYQPAESNKECLAATPIGGGRYGCLSIR
jgi:hypothetical protein